MLRYSRQHLTDMHTQRRRFHEMENYLYAIKLICMSF